MVGGNARTNSPTETSLMKIDDNPPKETVGEIVAGQVVTVESLTDALKTKSNKSLGYLAHFLSIVEIPTTIVAISSAREVVIKLVGR